MRHGLRHNDFSGVDTSSPATVLMITPGRSDSTFTVWVVLPLSPALSVALALNPIHRLTQCADRRSGHGLSCRNRLAVALYVRPFNITVTVVPVARPLEPPLMVSIRVFSALLIMSSPETVLMVSVGC